MQRVINYGSYLQAFALKKLIEKKGFNVEFLDLKNVFSLYSFFYAVKSLRYYLFLFLFNYKIFLFIRNKKFMFKKYFQPALGLKENLNFSLSYYKVIIGSDEMFNIKQHSPWRYNLQLFGGGFIGKVYTYAASFGNTTKDFIYKFPLRKQVVDKLKNIQSISIRDQNSKKIIKHFTNKDALIHLDPTLIYNFNNELNPIEFNQKFILIYSYDGRIKVNKQIKELIDFAKTNGYKIIGAGSFISFCDINLIPDPFELLSYFKKASYVLTDTFHGTIFSIIFFKQFSTILRKSNENKLIDILNNFKLNSRILKDNDNIIEILKENYDHKFIQETIEREKIKSDNYLNKILSND
jgi:hypothetical protein